MTGKQINKPWLKQAAKLGSLLLLSLSFTSAVFAQSEAVTQLVITDLPDTVVELEDFDFTLTAQDAGGSTITDYDGEVTFTSATDQNAVLPANHTFDPEVDSGEKIFNESYSFSTAGTQELTVTDVDNPDLTTTVTINVTSEEGDNSDAEITLTSPTAGVINGSTITVRGETQPGVDVQIFDANELLGTTTADIAGNFSFTTESLTDGTYLISAKTDNADSETVTVTLLTATPEIDFIEATPAILAPGNPIEVQLTVSNEAREVKTSLNGQLTTLVQDEINPKLYTGTIVAPSIEDNYPLSVTIESQLGETSNVTTEIVITVSGDSAVLQSGPDGQPVLSVPSQVTNVTTTSSDRRITLTWDPATASAGVKNYIIYFGTNADELNTKVETNDATTEWFIPELDNGQTYFFKVFAQDNNNNRGDQGSSVVAAIPGTDGPTTVLGSGNGQVNPPNVTKSGPGAALLLIGGGAFALARRMRQY